MKTHKYYYSALSSISMLVIVYCLFMIPYSHAEEGLNFWQSYDRQSVEQIDHSQWQMILDEYLVVDSVSGVNYVDYESLSTENQALRQYLDYLASLDPRTYNREQQFAYWVNLYNALTVNLIVNNYPLESITKLGEKFFSFGPWDDVIIKIAGQNLTLNDIEHRILRAFWDDHRIHFALNCASLGCPNLQDKAFTVNNTEVLLELAARQYLLHPRGLSFDENKLILSSIFDWYKTDFGDSEEQRLALLSRYLTPKLAMKIKHYSGKIKYHYDWSLNDSAVLE